MIDNKAGLYKLELIVMVIVCDLWESLFHINTEGVPVSMFLIEKSSWCESSLKAGKEFNWSLTFAKRVL